MSDTQVNISECIKNKSMTHVEMNEFKCHKLVHAIPMTAGVYFSIKDKAVPDVHEHDTNGYLVITIKK